jgi:HPt (histidine-containing phosphotransfer) domain-containing protein
METNPDSRQAEFDAQVAALCRRFLEGLPARRAAFADAWRECTDGGDDAPWQRLRAVAHKLSGSAPCYGLEAMGEAARALDLLLSRRPACRARADASAAVTRLQAALDAAIDSG